MDPEIPRPLLLQKTCLEGDHISNQEKAEGTRSNDLACRPSSPSLAPHVILEGDPLAAGVDPRHFAACVGRESRLERLIRAGGVGGGRDERTP